MKIRIDFPASSWASFQEHLLENSLEQAAFCLAEPVRRGALLRLLVREVITVPQSGLLAQSGAYVETDPLFFASLIKRARLHRYSVLIAHSHPFSVGTVGFSSIDDRGERDLIPKIRARVHGLPHGAVVVGHGAVAARVYLGNGDPVNASVRVIGSQIRDLNTNIQSVRDPRYHRQILAFGSEFQGRLASTRVAVVGCGGIGSHVLQQLLHLGVGAIKAIDPDLVTYSNLNRLVGATADDASTATAKAEVAVRLARLLGRDDVVESVTEDVLSRRTALQLADVDVIFGCTDNLATRALLNRVSIQYLIPLIDFGMDLEVNEAGQIRTGAGRVTVVSPDGSCLHSANLIEDPLVTNEGYVRGSSDPAPAVIAFNGVIASLGIVEFMSLLGAFASNSSAQWIYAPFRRATMRENLAGMCQTCAGLLGVGDSRSLPWDWSDSAATAH